MDHSGPAVVRQVEAASDAEAGRWTACVRYAHHDRSVGKPADQVRATEHPNAIEIAAVRVWVVVKRTDGTPLFREQASCRKDLAR
jgi:hypothetical protein